jgi:hypothetical protein
MDLLVQLLQDNHKTHISHKQVGFFKDVNLDKNIQNLKKSLKARQNFPNHSTKNKSLNKSSRYSENSILTHKKQSMNTYIYPNIELSEHTKSIMVPTIGGDYKSVRRASEGANQLREKQVKEEMNIRFLYNKIFSKEYQEATKKNNELAESKIIPQSSGEELSFMHNELNDVKTRILFIKNIFDYTYPKIMVEKLKTMKDIIHRLRTNREEKEYMKVLNKEKNKTKIVLQSSNAFKSVKLKPMVEEKLPELIPVLYHSSSTFYNPGKRFGKLKRKVFLTNNSLGDF